MKKNLLLMLTLIFVFGLSWAQKVQENTYTFMLNGNVITPQVNFQETKNSMKAKYGEKAPEHLGWFIIQFNSIPTIKEQKQLRNQGITLLEYLQGNAFFASVKSKFLALDSKETKNLRSLISIKPEYKINQDLTAGDIPEYAKGSNDYVKVVITYFKDVDELTLSKGVSNIRLKDKMVNKKFNQINAEVSKSELLKLASLDYVQNIELIAPPAELENNHGKSLHRANVLNSKIQGLGYGLTGKGVKIGLWDANVYNHRDFNGRVTNREYEMHTTDHGTHTCGTITSAGLIDPKAQGMAPEATIFAWNFNTQSNGLSVPSERLLSLDNDGIEITSNSYGYTVSSCPNPYAYNSTDRNEDLIAGWYPYFLYVYSAGNNQTVCPTGFYTTSKNLKNSLIVAAIDQLDNMSSFSSFGPSKDGRLIPNISGDGVNTYSTFLDNGYGIMSGTSMATPGVAGTMALVYQRYKETHGEQQPVSALMRALACNTAYDLGNPGPDFKYGYGEINGLRAVEVMEKNNYFTDSVGQSENFSKTINIPAGAVAVKVMLSWTDPAGTVGASKILVNDLNLKVSPQFKGSSDYLPWVLNPASPNDNATRGIDNLNNLEQVTISNPTAGSYTINVEGFAVPQGRQEFAIVYDIVMPTLKITYPIGDERLTPGNQEVIRWDCEGYSNNFVLEYSADNGVNYTVIASNIQSSQRSFLWTVPTSAVTNGKFRISNGSALNITKGSFTIMSTPQNVRVAQAQCDGVGPFALQWDAVANAKYEVLKLHGQTYEHLAEVTTTNYNITNIPQNNDNWYCVRAIDLTSGAISERSIAATLNPSVSVISLPFSEKFESQKATNFYFTSTKGQGNVRYVNDAQKYGIRLEGTSGTTTDWVAGTGATCFTNNPNYIVTANICNIDATSLLGKHFTLKFDYREKYRTAAGTSYFRVKVNGTYLTNSESTQIYGATNQVNYKTVYYDLSAYAGMASVSVVFEAVFKTNYTTYVNTSGNYDFSNDANDVGDFVTIDNVELYEPPVDVALTSYTFGTGLTNNETISVKVKNLSGDAISNIPVSYVINNGTIVNETITGPVAPFTETSYNFTQKADLSVPNKYSLTVNVAYPNDINALNNSLSATKYNNGTDYLMGVSSGTKTTCSAVLTDVGGRFADYTVSQNSTITFKPDVNGKNSKVTFSEFALEDTYDFLYIYDGPSTSYPLLGKFSGNNLPSAFTSSATNGELTFKFTSDSYTNDKGFVATIECVDKPATDAGITSVSATLGRTSTETITIKVKNVTSADMSNVPVWFQVDNGTKYNETITGPIAAYTEATYIFTQKADLSAAGPFVVTAGVDYPGDEVVSNNTLSATVYNDYLMGVATGTIVTCNAALTDVSGRSANYTNSQNSTLTFKPGTAGKSAKVTFTEFALENTYDFLYVYDGPTTSSTLLGKYTGSTLPPSFTSSVIGGELTFVFTSDGTGVDKGFLANIECVPGPVFLSSDAGISALTINPKRTSLTTITATIKNYGSTDISGFDIAYKINGGTEVTQTVVGPIVGGSSSVVTFTTLADLQDPTSVYTIEVYTKLTGDLYADNDKMTKSIGASSTNVVGSFSNGTSLITSSNITQFSLTNNFTVEMWLKPDQNPKYGTIFSKGVSITHHSEYYPAAYGSNCLIISITGQTYLTPSNSIKNGVWQHVALTSASDGSIKVYINGVQQTLANTNKATQSANLTTPLRLGGNSTLTQPYYGALDEVRVWNSELSQSAIQTGMVTDFAANTSGLLAYYKFKEGSGDCIRDYSSNDNCATIAGANVTNTGTYQFWNTPGFLLKDLNFAGEKIPTAFDTNTSTFYSVLNGANLSALAVNFTAVQQSTIKISGVTQTSGITTNDFSGGSLTYIAEGTGFNTGIIQNYTVTVVNSACELTAYTFETADNASLSNQIALTQNGNNFYKKVSVGMDLTSLKARFTVSPGAKVYINGIEQTSPQSNVMDYTNPIMLTLVSGDGKEFKNYKIDVDTRNTAADLTSLTLGTKQVGSTIYNNSLHTVSIIVKNNVDVTMLNPTFTISTNANVYVNSVTQRSGITTNNFTNPLIYTVVSEDESTSVDWTVTVIPDLTKPVITLLGNSTVNLVYGESYIDAGATASDNTDGDITSSIVKTSTVNTSLVGSYTVKYNVTDAAGNIADEITRTVNIAKAPLTVTADDQSKAYGTVNPTLTFQYSGFVNNESVSVLTTVPTANTTIDATTVVGVYSDAITVSGGVDENYSFNYVAGDFTITKATATINITSTTQTYDGTAKSVTTATTPAGLTVDVTYDGSTTVPTNAGTYAVVATINDANYQGTQNGSLTISKATATVTITNTTQVYNGTAKTVTVTTVPANLNYTVTYDGSATAPTNPGNYAVIVTINEPNYQGTQNATLEITPGVGVDPNDLNSVRIYSNAKDIFVEIPVLEGTAQLGIFNILGAQVHSTVNLIQGLNKIEGNFISGTYIIKVVAGKKVYTQKVILK